MKSDKSIENISHMDQYIKGITLIALITTIIILLILAGMVINLTLRKKWNIRQNKICSR